MPDSKIRFNEKVGGENAPARIVLSLNPIVLSCNGESSSKLWAPYLSASPASRYGVELYILIVIRKTVGKNYLRNCINHLPFFHLEDIIYAKKAQRCSSVCPNNELARFVLRNDVIDVLWLLTRSSLSSWFR